MHSKKLLKKRRRQIDAKLEKKTSKKKVIKNSALQAIVELEDENLGNEVSNEL
jgi:hypothetical protein